MGGRRERRLAVDERCKCLLLKTFSEEPRRVGTLGRRHHRAVARPQGRRLQRRLHRRSQAQCRCGSSRIATHTNTNAHAQLLLLLLQELGLDKRQLLLLLRLKELLLLLLLMEEQLLLQQKLLLLR
jgi:hypothetical protein